MKHLKTLTLSFVLISALAVVALADGPDCAPGQTSTPPCTGQALTDGSTNPGEQNGPPSSDSVDLIGLAETALMLLL
jgi:hypothetical protein